MESIQSVLQEQCPGKTFHISTLARTLDRWGFEFGKGHRTQHLKEKDYIIAARRRYLRQIRDNRGRNGRPIRPEVYLDESYVNKNHSNDLVWYSSEEGPWIQKPTGKGERLIILNSITQDGWVPKTKIVFKSTKKTGDYHGQMNGDLFQQWFVELLLPNIPSNSIMVMDNASYHHILSESSAPTSACSKDRILNWLVSNKIPCAKDCMKVELIELDVQIRKLAYAKIPQLGYA